MTSKHRCLARAVLLITLSASVGLVAAAGVASGMTRQRATTTVAPQQAGSVTAKCQRRQVALASGFASPDWDPTTASGGPVARFTSMPVGKRSIETAGFNFNETDAYQLDSFAYCGKRSDPPKSRSDRVRVPSGTFGSATAECPRGSQAISGGFATNQGVITLTSKLVGTRKWRVAGVNISDVVNPGGQAWLKAYAYCKAPGPTILTESKDATVGLGFQTTDVICPKNGEVISGGFDGHIAGVGGQLSAAGALDSKRTASGHGWTTSALSVSAPTLATITTYAYCRG
jgi:hypothetical protein